ncbi:hypothetical protein ACT3TB_11050 [Micrococcaceae sp. AOP34-BR2-30]
MTTLQRTCSFCGEPLPDGSNPTRKYCSTAHRHAASRRRRSFEPTTEKGKLRNQLNHLAEAHAQVVTELARSRTRVADRDRTITELCQELATERRRSADAIWKQANRTSGVRDQLATATNELTTLRRNWTAAQDTATAGPDVTQLRTRLASIQNRYDRLAGQYAELAEAAQDAATERAGLQGIVRHWDSLCRRLYKASNGQPSAAKDKEILATWIRFRSSLSGPGDHTPATDTTGHDRTAATPAGRTP